MTRFILFAIVALLNKINLMLVQGQASYMVNLRNAIEGKALHGHTFLNLTDTPILSCFEQCVKHCRCTAFHICEKTQCQLLSSNRFLSPSALRRNHVCTYYDLSERQLLQNNNQGNSGSCMSVAECCKTSKTCLNGGTCLHPAPNSKSRFTCNCPKGYTGERCEEAIRSCRTYRKGSRIPGIFTVFDGNNDAFNVFCDFHNTSSMTWTLIQSYQLQYQASFHTTFGGNSPINENDPSWFQYRLSKSRMESIQKHSTKWRFTCRYDTDGMVYTDYARGLNSQVNLLTFESSACLKVEYIDIRGYNCSDCSTYFQQSASYHAFINSYHSSTNCDFKPTGSTTCTLRYGHPSYQVYGYNYEDNFGYYQCVNAQHRCSSSSSSTTQAWFGGE